MATPFDQTKLGIAVNTVRGIPKAAKDTAVDIAQSIPRSLISTGLTLAKPLKGPESFAAKDQKNEFTKKIFTAMLGDEPVYSIEDRIAATEISIKNNKFAQEIGADKFALPLAFGGIFGQTALDLTPVGGTEKTAVELLAKETNPRKIARTLQGMKIDDSIVPRFANLFAKTTKPEEAKEVMDLMNQTLGVKEVANKLNKILPEFQSMRDEMQAAYTAERAKRLAQAAPNMDGTQGQEGYLQALSSLKGKLLDDVPTMDGIKEQFTEPEIDSLFNAVATFEKFSPFDKITASDGVMKLLEGEIPQQNQLDKLGQVFGTDFAAALKEKPNAFKRMAGEAANLINLPRVFQTIGDLSAVLRQGVVQTFAHPVRTSKAFPEMFRQGFDEMNTRLWLDQTRSSPDFPQMEKSGLYIADPTNQDVMKREEQFLSNIPEKIPLLKSIVGFSQRSYIGFLNKVRVDSFRAMKQNLEEIGAASDENLKAVASWVNNTTGRGELGKLEGSAEALNVALFSPRLMASRINMLNPYNYYKMPGPVRREALKDMAKAGSMLMLVNGLYALNGYDVEYDPRSADFLKVRDGDKRIDFGGGFGQYIRTVARVLTGQTKSTATGKVKDFDPKNPFSETRGSTMLNFIRSKLAPIPSSLTDASLGTDFMGEEFDLSEEAISYLRPLYYEDMKQLMKTPGLDSSLSAFFAILGAGLQIYEKPKSKSGPL